MFVQWVILWYSHRRQTHRAISLQWKHFVRALSVQFSLVRWFFYSFRLFFFARGEWMCFVCILNGYKHEANGFYYFVHSFLLWIVVIYSTAFNARRGPTNYPQPSKKVQEKIAQRRRSHSISWRFKRLRRWAVVFLCWWFFFCNIFTRILLTLCKAFKTISHLEKSKKKSI